ncbi:MAG: YicC family protein [Crocinitomicaceae bacterium]|nr:YicC family protein [Crocinitomicaceae bacterium]MBP6033653.1 YicC family protein [Crocinitomicaceae bacterium]
MLQSMTGFGKSNGLYQSKKVSIEIRSLNSKGLDLNLRIPSAYRELESELRKLLGEQLDRGKIDFGIYIESQADQSNGLINTELATLYYQELKKLNESWSEAPVDYLSLVLRLPDVLNQQAPEVSDEEKKFIMDLALSACEKLTQFRAQEGEALHADFTEKIESIRNGIQEIRVFEPERIQVIRERISKALSDLSDVRIDENRLEQEMIFYLEKLDVSEEKMRLTNHLDYFLNTMVIPRNGKKLGFICQEMGREINTLGSKCNHAEIQKRVVDMKDNLEKMKEQILNTL